MAMKRYSIRTLLLAVAAVAIAIRLIQGSWYATYVLPQEQGKVPGGVVPSSQLISDLGGLYDQITQATRG
jgi:hypothetical protein